MLSIELFLRIILRISNLIKYSIFNKKLKEKIKSFYLHNLSSESKLTLDKIKIFRHYIDKIIILNFYGKK